MVFIPKPRRKDLVNPANRQLISLLLVINKGLERLVAKKLTYVIISKRLLSPQYVRAIPVVGIPDLAYTLVYNLEKSQAKGLYIGTYLLDVKRGFNNV